MKWLWCWRRRAEMPMLDEAEAEDVFARDPPTGDGSITGTTRIAKLQWHDRVLAGYERLTGFRATDINVVWHHRLVL